MDIKIENQAEPSKDQNKSIRVTKNIPRILPVTMNLQGSSGKDVRSSTAELSTVTGVVGERRSPSDSDLVDGISSVGAVALVPSTLVEGALLDTTLAVLDLHVRGEEVAGGVGALLGDDVALGLATRVVKVAIREGLDGQVGIAVVGQAIRLGCVDGTTAELGLGPALNGCLTCVYVVAVRSGDDNLELVAVLTLVGSQIRSYQVTPEGSLNHSGGCWVWATRSRVL